MKSPFTYIDSAFEVFYDEQIVVECKDGRKQTLDVCVFTDNTAEPINEEMLDSEREDIAIIVSDSCWDDILSKVKRGDVVRRPCMPNNGKYTVSSVIIDSSIGLIVRARSVK